VSTTYVGLFGSTNDNNEAQATEGLVQAPMPAGGTVRNLYIRLEANNAVASSTYTFTVRKNGVDTGVTCQIGNGSNICNDTTNTAVFVAGDNISIEVTPSSPTQPTDNLEVHWTATYS
jgi:hypothetical protein